MSHQASEGGQCVDARHVETQHPAGITQGALGAIGDQRRRQRRAFAAVFAVDVGDDLVAPLVLEIDVDIRRFAALLRDEAFEQHAGPLRIDGGDAQREADRWPPNRALAENPDLARMADDVVNRQK